MKDLKTDSAAQLKVKETIVVDQEPSEVEVASAVCVDKEVLEESVAAAAKPAPAAMAPAPSMDNSNSFPEPAPDLGARYDVLDFVGSGGMGTVWKVYDRELKETFAIKVLKPELLADDVSLKRFQQEARLATDLTHANIAAIFGPGEDTKGRPYIIMRYVEGESLAQLIERTGPLDPDRAMELFWQINDALAHSHLKGIVHRDIKPSNIIISRTESGGEIAQLVDFGISSSVHEKAGRDQTLTQTGNVLGSPRYMSPEQFLGQDVGPESDMYSLGCVLYEMLTGTPPFIDPNPVKLILQHLNEKPNLEFVPQKFRMLVGSLLEKSPGMRIAAVRALHSWSNFGYLASNDSKENIFYIAIIPLVLSLAAILTYPGGTNFSIFVGAVAIIVILLSSISVNLQSRGHTIIDKTHSESIAASKIGTISGLTIILLQPFFFSTHPMLVPGLVLPLTFYFLSKIKSETSIQLSATHSSNRRISSKDEIEVSLKRYSKLIVQSRKILLWGSNLILIPILTFVEFLIVKCSSAPVLFEAASIPLGILILLSIANAFNLENIDRFSRKTLLQENRHLPSLTDAAKGFLLVTILTCLFWAGNELTMPRDYKVLVKSLFSDRKPVEKKLALADEAPQYPHSEMGDLARLEVLKATNSLPGFYGYQRVLNQQILKSPNYENNEIKAQAYVNLALLSGIEQQNEYLDEAIKLIKSDEKFKFETPASIWLKSLPSNQAKTIDILAESLETTQDLPRLKRLHSAIFRKGSSWAFHVSTVQRKKIEAAIRHLEAKEQTNSNTEDGSK